MRLDFELTDPLGQRATMGLIALQSDETIEHDFRRLLPTDGVAFYVSRVPSGLDVTPETLAAMETHMPAAATLLPRPAAFDIVGYGCTSGTSVIGPQRVAELISGACTTKAVTEPLTALVAACNTLSVSRLGFLSPYVGAVSETLRGELAARGIESPVFGSFEEAEEAKVARIAPQSIIDGALSLASSDQVDAVFLSCTNLRTLDVIEEIETKTGKPVLSSNQVLAWHMCRSAGLPLADRSVGALSRT